MTILLKHLCVCVCVCVSKRGKFKGGCVCVYTMIWTPGVKDGEQNARCAWGCVDTLSSCLLVMCDKAWLFGKREESVFYMCVSVCVGVSNRLWKDHPGIHTSEVITQVSAPGQHIYKTRLINTHTHSLNYPNLSPLGSHTLRFAVCKMSKGVNTLLNSRLKISILFVFISLSYFDLSWIGHFRTGCNVF